MRPSINYSLTSQWNGGYVMEVFITNPGTQTLHDYQVGFELPGTITDVWDGTITAHNGDSYVIADDDDKNDIAPGETVRFKFKVLTDSGELPSNFAVNGQQASVNGEESTPDTASSQPQESTDDSAPSQSQDTVSAPAPSYEVTGQEITVDSDISAAELEALIAKAPEGATIYLGAGDYRFDDSIDITRSDIALVGAGSGKTTLTFTDKALDNDDAHAIYVEGTDTQSAGYLKTDADEGDNTLTLGKDHGLEAGDTVRIWQDNTQAYFDEIGDTSWQKDNAPLRTSMAKVVAVDGTSVTLDRGVHFDFDGGDAKIERMDALENVTLQGFSIHYELGTPDNAKFSNTLSDLKDYQAVKFDGTVNGNVTDVQVINGPSTAFEFALSLDLNVDGAQAHGAFNKGSGGNGYAYELRESYDGTFTNLEDTGMRHSLIFASWRSSVGNDAHVKSTDRDINFHGGQDHDNTVHVEQSIRDADADGMSTTLWYNNGGESFGAITEAGVNQITLDYVIGSKRDDVLQGSNDGVYLNGALGSDTLYGGAGDDILSGGGGWGNNRLDGGDGFDTALFDQDYDDYKIRFNDDGSVYVDGSSNDTLVNVEQAIFADGTILDLASRQASQGDKPSIPTPKEILQKVIEEAEDAVEDIQDTITEELEEIVEEAEGIVDDILDTIEDALEPPVGETAPLNATVALETVSQWSNGYVMRVVITNASGAPIVSPQIDLSLAADIDTLYGATLLERNGDTYRIAYDGSDTLEAGDTLRFSFKTYAPEDVQPQVLALNGQALNAETPSAEEAEPVIEEPQQEPSNDETVVAEPVTEEPQQDAPATDTNASEPAPEAAPLNAEVNLETVSQWSNGYVMRVVITNTSDASIDSPQIDFSLGADIDTLYGATLLDRNGDTYSVAYDGSDTLEPGATMQFSFKTYAPSDVQPQVLAINGQSLSADDTRDDVTDPVADAPQDEAPQDETPAAEQDSDVAPDSDASEADSQTPGLDDMLSVTSNITSAWSKGYVAEAFVENTSDFTLVQPTFDFELPGDIEELWNGTFEQDGDEYAITAINAGQELEPGEIWRFSYKSLGDEQSLPGQADDLEIVLTGVEAQQIDAFSL